MKFLYIFLLFFTGNAFSQNPYPRTEMRGVWVATIGNIDWPSRKNLSSEAQQKEYTELLDKFRKANFNTILTQVRPSADAFYESSYEPWAEALQGKQGTAPSPYYDPMAWAIGQCHQRNLEFHAWVNPFRAISSVAFSDIHPSHITQKEPEWFFRYGDRVYFNPGIPEVRHYLIKVIMEMVRKYDMDGLHFDDYFYPYTITGEKINDDDTFDKFGRDFTDLHDWRRNNINLFIEAISDSLKAIKPKLKFGVSPVGGWRNKDKDPRGSDTRVGQPSYDNVFADTRKWLEMGWIDYLTPQIYWSTKSKYVPYEKLLAWWQENNFRRHIYVGHAAFKIGDADQENTWQQAEEILRQIILSRKYSAFQGGMFFSASSLLRNPLKTFDNLQAECYKYPAIVPAMKWKDSIPPFAPDSLKASIFDSSIALRWQNPQVASDGEIPAYYIVFRFNNELEINLNDASKILSIQKELFFLDKDLKSNCKYIYIVKSFDRLHNESLKYAVIKIATVRKLTMASPIRIGTHDQ